MVTLLKLGGSLITDKTQPKSFRGEILLNIIEQLKQILTEYPDLKWIIGHGSGSFGHVEAKKHDTINGVHSKDEWLGFSKVAFVASQLSQLVWAEFIANDIPVVRFHPSSSLLSNDGLVEEFNTNTLKRALADNLIPMIHGDVAFDKAIGGTIISTESQFQYLIQQMDVERIILLGEVDGVLDADGHIIPNITPQNFESIKSNLKGSRGVDVTGGMYQKVADMLQIVQKFPHVKVIIANGNTPNILQGIVENKKPIGTSITENQIS